MHRGRCRLLVSGSACSALVILSLAITACSSSSGSGTAASTAPQTSSSATASATSSAEVASIRKLLPSNVLKQGTISVGTREDSAPADFEATSGGPVTGWEIDLMNNIAEMLGVTIKYNYTSFDSLIPGIQSGRYQLAFGAMGTTAARQKVVDFVSWVTSGGSFIATAADNSAIASMNGLCGKQVAVAGGTRVQDFADAQSSTCKSQGMQPVDVEVYQTANEAYMAVRSGRANIFYGETTDLSYLAKQSNGQAVIVGHDDHPTPLGVVFPKGSPLIPAFTAALKHLIADGAYKAVLSQWGEQNAALTNPALNPATGS
jgi:polar amino acid transport system substrate-binding protein